MLVKHLFLKFIFSLITKNLKAEKNGLYILCFEDFIDVSFVAQHMLVLKLSVDTEKNEHFS